MALVTQEQILADERLRKALWDQTDKTWDQVEGEIELYLADVPPKEEEIPEEKRDEVVSTFELLVVQVFSDIRVELATNYRKEYIQLQMIYGTSGITPTVAAAFKEVNKSTHGNTYAGRVQDLHKYLKKEVQAGNNPIDYLKFKTKQILSTEWNRLLNQAKLAVYDQAGVQTVVWTSRLSKQTCNDCRSKHGGQYTVQAAKGKIPNHSSCRCYWTVSKAEVK